MLDFLEYSYILLDSYFTTILNSISRKGQRAMEESKLKYRVYILDIKIEWAHLKHRAERRFKVIDWHVIPKTSLYGALYYCRKNYHCEFIGKSHNKDGLPIFVHPFDQKNDIIIGISNLQWSKGFYFCAISKIKRIKDKLDDFMLFGGPEVLNVKPNFGKENQSFLESVYTFCKNNNIYSSSLKDYQKWGPLSYLIKGYRLLEIGETVGDKDYFWNDGSWLSVTFRESYSPIKPGDVISQETENVKRTFVMRKK